MRGRRNKFKMKYVAELGLKKNELRADYRRIFISFFKKSISEYMDGYFFDEIYNSGARRKDLVWSVRFSKPAFKDGMMSLEDNRVILTIKLSDTQTALIYYSAILGFKDKEFPLENGNSMILKKIKMINETEITEDFAIFKILSPVCVRLHDKEKNKDIYYSHGDVDFEAKLKEVLSLDMPDLKAEIESLEFDFSNLRKVIVPAFSLKLPATIGSFAVKGDRRILNHILSSGMGSRRNSGFGLLESLS